MKIIALFNLAISKTRPICISKNLKIVVCLLVLLGGLT